MIHYITMLITCEHNQILFHVTMVLNAINKLYHDLKHEP